MNRETSNAREGDSTEGCRQGVGRDRAHNRKYKRRIAAALAGKD
jgi:hypothetical protein